MTCRLKIVHTHMYMYACPILMCKKFREERLTNVRKKIKTSFHSIINFESNYLRFYITDLSYHS